MCAQIKPTLTVEPSILSAYEPPRIEVVLTSEELEREVIYAGAPSFR